MRIILSLILFTSLNVSVSSCKDQNIFVNKPADITSYNKEKVIDCNFQKKIVLIGGCFDLLHYGHIEYLKKSKDLGDYLIVALEPDEHIIKYKKRQPVHNQSQRANNLASIRYVDNVLMLPMLKNYNDYFQLVQDTCPNIIAVTKGDPQLANIEKQAKNIGAKVEIVIDRLNEFSTTNILNCKNCKKI